MKHEVCRSGLAIGIKHEAGGVSSEPGEIAGIVIDEVCVLAMIAAPDWMPSSAAC
jgi:hypothetical protein